MRLRHTIACAAVGALLAIAAPINAFAQSATSTPQRYTAADFLRLSADDQNIWLNGAVEGLGAAVFLTNEAGGRCILQWYTAGGRLTSFQAQARAHPTERPMTLLIAMTNRQCRYFSPRN